jgi:hypothetical protein
MRTPIKGSCIAVLVLSFVACGRDSTVYRSFVASHDSIRPGMSIRQVFESGLADYLIRSDGKNVAGSTLPGKMPISSECSRYVVDIHSGGGAFSLRVYCDMNGPSNRQMVSPGLFSNRQDFLNGLDQFKHWTQSTSFRVESPALRIGGVYDSYEFAIDESGTVTSVSAIRQAPFAP